MLGHVHCIIIRTWMLSNGRMKKKTFEFVQRHQSSYLDIMVIVSWPRFPRILELFRWTHLMDALSAFNVSEEMVLNTAITFTSSFLSSLPIHFNRVRNERTWQLLSESMVVFFVLTKINTLWFRSWRVVMTAKWTLNYAGLNCKYNLFSCDRFHLTQLWTAHASTKKF